MEWQMVDAEHRLGELLSRATNEGPQTIRNGGAAVVVIAEPAYRALTGAAPSSLKQLLLDGPSLEGVGLDRDPSPPRGVDR